MNLLDPYEFFVFEGKRFLIDARDLDQFDQESLPEAISLPLRSFSSYVAFFKEVVRKAKGIPIHLFDQEGSLLQKLPDSAECSYLTGGFQAFTEWRAQCLTSRFSLFILGGYTGSGKTQMLSLLKKEGIQILDLEHLANHRGSIFGKVPQSGQESQVEFQPLLLKEWLQLDPNKPLIIEEKGPFLGSERIPIELYERMKRVPLLHLELSFPLRVDHILSSYPHLSGPPLEKAIERLSNRMGAHKNKKAITFLREGKRRKCVEVLLAYYDQAYKQRRGQYWTGSIQPISCQKIGDPEAINVIKKALIEVNR